MSVSMPEQRLVLRGRPGALRPERVEVGLYRTEKELVAEWAARQGLTPAEAVRRVVFRELGPGPDGHQPEHLAKKYADAAERLAGAAA